MRSEINWPCSGIRWTQQRSPAGCSIRAGSRLLGVQVDFANEGKNHGKEAHLQDERFLDR